MSQKFLGTAHNIKIIVISPTSVMKNVLKEKNALSFDIHVKKF